MSESDTLTAKMVWWDWPSRHYREVDLIAAMLQDHSPLVPDTRTILGGGGDAQSLAGLRRARYLLGFRQKCIGLQKLSQYLEREARVTGCGGHLLGRGCILSRLIGLLPLLHQKNTGRGKMHEERYAYPFLQAQNIYILDIST